MNYTRKLSSTAISRDLSLAAIFVISMTCSCIVREPSNFMVVKVLINVPVRDLSAIWEHSSTKFHKLSCTFSFGKSWFDVICYTHSHKHQTKSFWPFPDFIMGFLFSAACISNSSKLFNMKNHIRIQHT